MAAEDRLDGEQRAERQAARLGELLSQIHGRNRFYTAKLDAAGIAPGSLRLPDDLARLPFTTKAELIADQAAHPPWGTVLTFPVERYTRYCQTSSTTGAPLRWIDTAESWQWMLECWKAVYRAAGVGTRERAFFPFSFGPFLGFWAGFEAGAQLGLHVVPGGGMSSEQRLATIDAVAPTVVCCTPTYALRLAEVAARQSPGRLARSSVRVLLVAGEPGGSIPATRRLIEQAWGARVFDHHGLTEVGPVSFECQDAPGFLHVNEAEYICEVIEPGGAAAVSDGDRGELVLTNLGRIGSPVIRYRTGDLVVRRTEPCACGRTFARLEGGVLARTDDMVSIRGANVYPGAIEAIIRDCSDVVEFRAVVSRRDTLPTLTVDVELTSDVTDAGTVTMWIAGQLRQAFGLNVPVTAVAPGTLPRFETKARRFVVER